MLRVPPGSRMHPTGEAWHVALVKSGRGCDTQLPGPPCVEGRDRGNGDS